MVLHQINLEMYLLLISVGIESGTTRKGQASPQSKICMAPIPDHIWCHLKLFLCVKLFMLFWKVLWVMDQPMWRWKLSTLKKMKAAGLQLKSVTSSWAILCDLTSNNIFYRQEWTGAGVSSCFCRLHKNLPIFNLCRYLGSCECPALMKSCLFIRQHEPWRKKNSVHCISRHRLQLFTLKTGKDNFQDYRSNF